MSNSALNHAFGLDLPTTEKFVLVAIADRTNDKVGGLAWPSIPELVSMTSTSRSSVKRSIRALVAKGHLDVVEPAVGTRSARYRILGRGATVDPLRGASLDPLGDRRGSTVDPLDENVGGSTYTLEGPPWTARGSTLDPKPKEPNEEQPAPHAPARPRPRGGHLVDAEEAIVAWSEKTQTPLTRRIRARWYADAVEFVAGAAPELLDSFGSFLSFAFDAGCRTPGGWVHYVADWTRDRARSGRGLYDPPEPRPDPMSDEQIAAAVGRQPGESVAAMLRRRSGEDQT